MGWNDEWNIATSHVAGDIKRHKDNVYKCIKTHGFLSYVDEITADGCWENVSFVDGYLWVRREGDCGPEDIRIFKRYTPLLAYHDSVVMSELTDESGRDRDDFYGFQACTDGTYIYTTNHMLTGSPNDGGILKIKKSDLSYVDHYFCRRSEDFPEGFDDPYAITTDGTYLYITDINDYANSGIQKRKCSDLSHVSETYSVGTGNDDFKEPYGITNDGTYLYISDTYNHRIKKHKCSDLSYVSQIGTWGDDNDLQYPMGIVYHNGFLFVADNEGPAIRTYKASDLSYISSYGTSGSGDDDFGGPFGISIDDDAVYFYVIDYQETSGSRLKKHKLASPPPDDPDNWQKLTGGHSCNF